MNNADKPAHPFRPTSPFDQESDNGFPGLTKREYFAAMAMQGILSNPGTIERVLDKVLESKSGTLKIIVTNLSIAYADDLLKQLNTPD